MIIGFKEVLYSVSEGEQYLTVEIEVKINVTVARPFTFFITVKDGEAQCEFSQCSLLCYLLLLYFVLYFTLFFTLLVKIMSLWHNPLCSA